jgi:hypothetical protein
MITTVLTKVKEQIISQNLLPPTIKIHPIVVDKNKVLAKGWVRNFSEHLKMVSFEENVSNDFDGIRYRVMRRKPDEPPFLFQMPITDTRKRLINTIKREVKQIPDNRKGVVIINSNSDWDFAGFLVHTTYVRQILEKYYFKIIAIIIWNQHGNNYKIIHRDNLSKDFLHFLEVPFQ